MNLFNTNHIVSDAYRHKNSVLFSTLWRRKILANFTQSTELFWRVEELERSVLSPGKNSEKKRSCSPA
jgi:hypothetical protein